MALEEILSKSKAKKILAETRNSIKRWDSETTFIKRNLYLLLRNESYVLLDFDSPISLLKDLAKNSEKHRSTLYDMLNAVLIELELSVKHGAMSTDALVELKKGTTEENRYEIFVLAKEYCNQNQDYPTRPMIDKAKLEFLGNQASNTDNIKAKEGLEATGTKLPPAPVEKKATSKTKEKEREQLEGTKQLQNSYINSQGQPDEDNQFHPSVVEIVKRIEKYTLLKKQRLLRRLKPTNSVDIDAAKLLHLMDDDQLKRFRLVLERDLSISLS